MRSVTAIEHNYFSDLQTALLHVEELGLTADDTLTNCAPKDDANASVNHVGINHSSSNILIKDFEYSTQHAGAWVEDEEISDAANAD